MLSSRMLSVLQSNARNLGRYTMHISSYCCTFGVFKVGMNLRCLESLKAEHTRIATTMQSYERLLDVMKAEAQQCNTVRPDRLKDLKKFQAFCNVYSGLHDRKDDILFDYARTNEVNPAQALKRICDAHVSEPAESGNNSRSKVYKQEVSIPNKRFLHDLYEHMQVENDIIYPIMEAQFNAQAMEELSQKINELNSEHAETINAMEFMADELNEKYTIC